MKKYRRTLGLICCCVVSLVWLFGCTGREEIISGQVEKPESGAQIRPDFATLDNRPQEEIASVTFTAEDATPVSLIQNKTGGKYALLIGISDYEGTSRDLLYCVNDIEDWEDHLLEQGYEVTKLINEQADGMSVWAALEDLAALSSAGNEIVFVFSGHGADDAMITWEGWYFSGSWTATTFENTTSEKILWVMDACKIGKYRALLQEGRLLGLASGNTTYSYDGDVTMQNGVYTYYIMEALDSLGYNDMEGVIREAENQMDLWSYRNGKARKVNPETWINYNGLFEL